MHTHVKTLAVLRIVYGAVGVVIGLFTLLVMGGIAGLVGIAGEEGGGVAAFLLGGLGWLIFLFFFITSVPSVVAGVGLLRFRPWARILTLVLSGLDLFVVPVGTALGLYGFYALLARDADRLFAS